MSDVIKFTIPIEPVPKARARLGRQGVFTPRATVKFENDVMLFAKAHAPEILWQGPVGVVLKFYIKKPLKPKFNLPAVRPDIDNYIKAVLDALNGVIWHDDGCVCGLTAMKWYATDEPKIEVEIRKISVL